MVVRCGLHFDKTVAIKRTSLRAETVLSFCSLVSSELEQIQLLLPVYRSLVATGTPATSCVVFGTEKSIAVSIQYWFVLYQGIGVGTLL